MEARFTEEPFVTSRRTVLLLDNPSFFSVSPW
jgi:hypothetical protein